MPGFAFDNWYAVFLPSANDAALAVAQANGGVQTTIRQMNAVADHLQANEWWLCDPASHLKMPIATMHRWQRVGWVTSRKVQAAGNRWAIFADAEELDRLTLLRNTPRSWPNPYPPELITPKPASDATPGTASTGKLPKKGLRHNENQRCRQ